MIESLPIFLTPLVGRERELDTLKQLLGHPEVRLVTITGPGGVGKTRLGVTVASLLENDFSGDIVFVSLVPINNPDLVLPTIAGALGIQDGDDPNRPDLDRVIRFIQKKSILLILDNFEHVIDAATVIPKLISACPNLKFIVTSREPLRVRGEQEFAVPLLGVPNIERVARDLDLVEILPQYSAVELFLDRMGAIRMDYEPDQAGFQAIAEICILLDGLPLAIELTAPRTRMFTPQQLLAQLGGRDEVQSLNLLTGGARDLPARQRTLRRMIQWSYDLLTTAEQQVFRSVSIFANTFTLPETEYLLRQIRGGDVDLALTNIIISSLVEKNLIVQADSDAEPRFRMLFMLHAFGRTEAARLGELPALQAAHAETFLNMAESAVPNLINQEQVDTAARLRRDLDNFRQALRWSLDQDEVAIAARIGSALWRFWLLTGLLSEGQKWLKEILSNVGWGLDNAESKRNLSDMQLSGPIEASRVATMLYGLGYLTYRQSGGGHPEVTKWLSQSRDLYLRIGDETEAALAEIAIALVLLDLHEDLAASQRLLEDSFGILKAAGHTIGLAENLSAQARNYFYLNQSDKANEAMQRSLDLLRDTGDLYGLAHATKFAGDLAYGRVGGYAEVRRHFTKSAEMFAALGNVTEIAVAKAVVGTLNGIIDGDWQGALNLVEEGRRVAWEHGNERAAVLCAAMASWVYGSLGQFTQAESVALDSIRTAFALSHHSAMRGAFIGLANAERLKGDIAGAVATVSAMMSQRTHYNSLPYSRGNSLNATSLSQMKRELDPTSFNQAWARGPERLLELLPQLASERSSWPLAPIPELDTPETPKEQITTSEVAAASSSAVPEPLTAREKDVLQYLVQGMTDQDIAKVLVMSPRTVHAHLRNIYGKLGVNSRTAATRLVLEQDLL